MYCAYIVAKSQFLQLPTLVKNKYTLRYFEQSTYYENNMKSSFAKTDNSIFNSFQKSCFFIVHSNYFQSNCSWVILIRLKITKNTAN